MPKPAIASAHKRRTTGLSRSVSTSFPAGCFTKTVVSPNNGNGIWTPDSNESTWITHLLPFIEQDNLYKQILALPGLPGNQGGKDYFNPNSQCGAWAYWTPPNSSDGNGTGYPHLADAHIKSYECPSDNLYAGLDPNLGGPIDAYWTEPGQIWIEIDPTWSGSV